MTDRIVLNSRGGIGKAAAIALAKLGCSIAVHHSNAASKSKADALVAELTQLNVRAAPFQADLSTYEETKKIAEATNAKGIRVLVGAQGYQSLAVKKVH